ncbi:helix-turn-helix domain-containing protein [Streptomyces violaceusniger]|uniref:Transcriptional regulator n=1 Tax=Streptomyces violaceusniger (strain Tu 4113) TaxID=653045 RepID=G2PH75_STRV4|nr:helix-turn-helix transcriptional regulator [Streptomyces violaceusniger]AEM88721.1 putative transcriptional regulator [Streptomyces violaceusniger Tu 4113]
MFDTGVGHPLVYARRMLGWSQEGLAARIRAAGIRRGTPVATTKKTVYWWERGRKPDELTQALIADVFEISDELREQLPWPYWLPSPQVPELYRPWTAAGTVDALGDVLRSGRMDRREFTILSGVTLTTLLHGFLTAEPAIAHAAAGGGRRISPAMVDHIADQITDLQRADDTHGGGDLVFEAEGLLSLTHHLLQTGSFPAERVKRRLYAQAADLGRMCGWMHFDIGRHAAGQRHFVAALKSASSSEDALLAANVLAFMSIQAYSTGHPDDADAMVRTAQTAVRGRSTPVVDAMLSARQARALAKAGETRDCYQALNRAVAHLERGPRDDDPPWAYWVNQAEIDMLTGSCMLDLGDAAAAQRKFTEADASYGPEYVRTHVLYLTRMATAQLQQRQVDAACASTGQALTLAAGVHSGRSSDHVRDAVKQLIPYRGEPAVHDLLDRAKTVTT